MEREKDGADFADPASLIWMLCIPLILVHDRDAHHVCERAARTAVMQTSKPCASAKGRDWVSARKVSSIWLDDACNHEES